MREEVIRGVPLHDRDIALAAAPRDVFRRDRGAHVTGTIKGKDHHRVAIGAQGLFHLQKSNADTGRLAATERLGTDEQNAAHPLPRNLSTIV